MPKSLTCIHYCVIFTLRNSNKHNDMKTQKNKTTTTELREPYYNLSSAIFTIQDKANLMNDAELKARAANLFKELDAIASHLDSNYKWD